MGGPFDDSYDLTEYRGYKAEIEYDAEDDEAARPCRETSRSGTSC